jgi:hypothetical protein
MLTLISPALAASQENKLVKVYSLLEDKPEAKPGKPSGTSVSIRNLASGDTVYSEVLIIAQATGTFDSVVYQINDGPETGMVQVGSSDRYQATWDTGTSSPGPYTLTVKAKSSTSVVSTSTDIMVVGGYQSEVYYEIDYMAGHAPSTSVLDYMVNYWKSRAVLVTYKIDTAVADPTPGDSYISDSDFWILEKGNNDGADNSRYGYAYTSAEKWMLYGTWDSSSNVGGYTYVAISGKDLVAGNYIFIADSMIDNWEVAYGIPSDGGAVIVTCHEAGHSVGIAVLRGGAEKYDADYYSIMSYMRLQNAKDMTGYWYYSKEYWSTTNLSLYPYVP